NMIKTTNVFISAWLWGGIPAHLFRLARISEIRICTSEAILVELENTLNKPKIQVKCQSLGFSVGDLMDGTKELGEVYSISTINIPELRDADDNIIIATAIASQADVIVTGDRDLLVL
ncbi:MAG: putative toxin-antitoxin system toxin component, PIN family, partial [Okeania sp. SIO3C4]|nr:putative toxin-antitoxin system toxin component, PIN family [Okeania sp. SIO3C4]